MLWKITGHEIRYRLRKISTYVYFLMLFAVSYLFMNAAGGAFPDTFSLVGPNVNVNSPYHLSLTIAFLSLFGVIITAAFMGRTIYRDYESNIHPLLFTTPVHKGDYLGGRFLGALAANFAIFLGIGLGLVLGEITPWLDADKFGQFRPMAYLVPYAVFVVPNLLVTGALFFALAATTRKMLPNYIGGIGLFLFYNIANLLLGGDALSNSDLASLLDPFGTASFGEATRYWTVAQQNTELVLPADMFLYNRLLWLGLAGAVFTVLYMSFDFRHLTAGRWFGSADLDSDDAPASPTQRRLSALLTRLDLPTVHPSYDLWSAGQQFLTLTKRSFFSIVRNKYFYALLAGGGAFLLLGASEINKVYGTEVYPLTRIIADSLVSQVGLIFLILIAFYAGELVWQERDLKVQPIHDAFPLSDTVRLVSKCAALGLVMALLLAGVMVMGILLQAANGFTEFQPLLYLQLLGLEWLDLAFFIVFAFTVHSLINHKYGGHFAIILYVVGFGTLTNQLSLEHSLYQFGSGLDAPYSDINGFGFFPTRLLWFTVHWSGVAALMLMTTRLAWIRGMETTLSARLAALRRRFSRPILWGASAAGLLLLTTGSVIVYNTTELNAYRTSTAVERLRADYEKTYSRYEAAPQPRVAGVRLDVDLYPERRDASFQGHYDLVNATATAIDSVHVTLKGSDSRLRALSFNRDATLADADSSLIHHRIFRLEDSLAPGDSMQMTFDVGIVTEGFAEGQGNTSLVENGTFLRSNVLPRLGYRNGIELSDPDTRADYNLPETSLLPSRTDSLGLTKANIAGGADWIDFHATVSTAADQTVLAPGQRTRRWTEDGRRHAEFRSIAPMLDFYTFVSARYDSIRTRWEAPDGDSVDVSVRYHPKHDYNVDRLMDGATAALDYYTENFGPYQNEYLRIAEFPRYHGGFAQSFLGTVPFSESAGFIARIETEDHVDYPFNIAAHEVAHQWWGHQVVGARVEGATMLSETLSEYSALMVMKERYGKRQMRRFLEYELDRYLSGRSQESRQEHPLVRVSGQNYIAYRKGANVMYALQDYIGEDKLNTALRRFAQRYRFEGVPYPTSSDLMAEIERVTPDSLQYVLDDWFREITLYENRATAARAERTADGRYRVTLDITTRKVRADSLGNETEVTMNDWVDVGVFARDASVDAQEQRVLYLEKHRLESGEQSVTVTVDEKPARAGVDPYLKLIDRSSDDNVTTVDVSEASDLSSESDGTAAADR